MRMDEFWTKVDGKMTYIFLGIIVGVYLLQWVTIGLPPRTWLALWTIESDFITKPWTIVTSMFAHDTSNLNHILFNGVALYFFGTVTERLVGTKRYTYLFLGAGAVAGIAQVLIMSIVFGEARPALGASGALQGVMGTLVVLAPTLTVYVFFFVPAPLWLLTIFYVLADIVGFISPGGRIANAAHLTGLAIGIWFGYRLRQQGLRAIVRKPPSMFSRR